MFYCSLGNGCMSSMALQSLGLKKESYPFDWLNSTSEIIKLSLDDDFKTFLDRSLYYAQDNEYDNEEIAQHRIYTPLLKNNPTLEKQILFRHNDPFANDEAYDYYVRSADRFRNLLKSTDEKLFIKTYINKGLEESLLEDALYLTEAISNHTTNFKIIAIKHSVTGEHSFKIDKYDNLIYVEITSMHGSDGGSFFERIDQTFFHSLLQYIINSK